MALDGQRQYQRHGRGALLNRRRNRISRADAPWIGVACVTGGVVAALAGGRPTGDVVTSWVVTAITAAAVAWCSASAPWWAFVAAGTGVTVFAGSVCTVGLGLAACVGGLVLGWTRAGHAPLRAGLGGAVFVASQGLDVGDRFGMSAALAAVVVAALAVAGLARRPRQVRRRAIIAATCVAGAALSGGALAAAAAASARNDIEDGASLLRDGFEALGDGDTGAAAVAFDGAAERLDDGARRIGAWWAAPGRAVPVISQHAGALEELADTAAAIASSLAATIEVTDLDQLTIRSGTIDPLSVAILAEPLSDVRADVERLTAALDQPSNHWLIRPVRRQIAEFAADARRVQRQVVGASDAAALGDEFLGVSRPARYLLVFSSPAESRGSGGVIGNWAEITLTDGRLQRTAFGRTNDLIEPLRDDPPKLDMPAEYLARYGPYGASSQDGTVEPKYWSNITMSPHFPSVGEAISQLYRAGTGRDLDGVVLLDPAGLATLVEATGPVTVVGVTDPLDADTLEQFLLVDQYQLEEADREAALEATAQAVLDALLSGDLPPAQRLAAILRPGFADGHILTWFTDDRQQRVASNLGIDGSIADPDGRDALAVVVNNAAGNKIDSYLRRTFRYEVEVDSESGSVTATATITLANDAPSTGLADYVIGNLVGLPKGTSRLLLSVYSPHDLTGATIDGRTLAMSRTAEQGWSVYTAVVDIPSGREVAVEVRFAGQVSRPYELLVHPQTLSAPARTIIGVTEDGITLFSRDTRFTEPTSIDRNGARRAR